MIPKYLAVLAVLAAGGFKVAAQNAAGTSPSSPPTPGAQQEGDNASAGGAGERIITITYDGGTRNSPDLRYGPYTYQHPEPEGIVATVSNLTVYTQQGELRAPEGVLIAEAEGEREAAFTGGVRVVQGRLTATGSVLNYSEATGRGVMPQETAIVVTPAEEGDDVTNIGADTVTFDVDTDTSVSQGNVTLTSGNQDAEAQELVFEEERDLAVMRNPDGRVTVRRRNDDGTFLTITADDAVRVLTGRDILLATGNIEIIDGGITTTGDTVYYDDEASRAEVIGNPAVSVDEEFGSTIRGGRIEQRTDLDTVQQLSDPTPSFDAAQFALTSETTAQ